MKTLKNSNRFGLRSFLYLSLVVLFVIGLGVPVLQVAAANPPPVQYYYITLPEDDLLKLFDDDQITLTT